MLEIIQNYNGEFRLKNGPREVGLTYEQASWILEDICDIPEFNMDLAMQFYKNRET